MCVCVCVCVCARARARADWEPDAELAGKVRGAQAVLDHLAHTQARMRARPCSAPARVCVRARKYADSEAARRCGGGGARPPGAPPDADAAAGSVY